MKRFTIPLITTLALAGLVTYSTIIGNKQATAPTQAIQPVQTVQVPTYEKPTPQRLLELTNAERVKAGVKPLIMDERLNQSAQKKVDEMAVEGWDDTPHENKDGVRGYTYIGQSMSECMLGSENLAKDYELNPILGFKSSKAHWSAVLDIKYEYIGFGITDKYIAVHFCSID